MKVLVTGAGALLGQGIIRSLRQADTPYEIIAADPDPRSVGLYWADRAYLIPLAKAPDYLDKVREILDRERPAVVLIGTDVELAIFAANKADLEADYDTIVLVSPPRVIEIADDKWQTAAFLRENGFPYPASALPAHLPAFLAEQTFPLIVKPRVGARSVGVYLVNDRPELDHALRQVDDPVIQECLATDQVEYTSGLLVSRGRAEAVVTMRRDLRDGNTYRAYVEPDAPFNQALMTIAEKLGGVGPLNFQYRLRDGQPVIFEINARFSGTTPFRAAAGYNEVDVIVRHFVRGAPIPPPQLQPVTILRHWQEIVVPTAAVADARRAGHIPAPTYQRPAF